MIYLINPQLFGTTVMQRITSQYERVDGQLAFDDLLSNEYSVRAIHELVQLMPRHEKRNIGISITSKTESKAKDLSVRVFLAIWYYKKFETLELYFRIGNKEKNIAKYINVRKPFSVNFSYNIIEESSSFIMIDGVNDLYGVVKHTEKYLRKMLGQKVVL